jgi:hypothetical protein
MKKAIVVAGGLVSLTGVIQLILGILFWTGHARALVPIHMTVGVVFVLCSWTLAGISARVGAPLGLTIATFVWGLVLATYGMMQTAILPGPSHWMVQVGHLLMAVVAMGLAGALQARARAALAMGLVSSGRGEVDHDRKLTGRQA